MRIEEKRATLAIHTLLKKYVDWTATESRCGNCENYDRIWSCPTYDFSVEAYWRQFFSVQLLGTKILWGTPDNPPEYYTLVSGLLLKKQD